MKKTKKVLSKNKQSNVSQFTNMPLVFKIEVVLSIISVVGLIFTLKTAVIFMGKYYTGTEAMIINLFFGIISGITVYGIIKRFKWTYNLYVASFIIGTLYLLSNIFMRSYALTHSQEVFQNIYMGFYFVLSAIMMYFVFKKRDYLIN